MTMVFSENDQMTVKIALGKRCRSSRPDVFCKKGVLRNFTKFVGKHLCQSLSFNKVAGLRPATLLKKRLPQVFCCEFCEISKNTFFYRIPLVAAFEYRENSKHLHILVDLKCIFCKTF